ncbi:TOBE domain-containing protein [Phenylobacterium sp.]|uniref:TOBE domain-containing protein n=1 Tax=Phenylobacterium sp. TaxID=1871053 RepID=UPI0027226562|nr:TOBE domain-containing protein [Phenylobacterium sp.]MDO8379040.1 TOBE domain-containing protein [Phenylobacterium sp.]
MAALHTLTAALSLRRDGARVGGERIALLEAIGAVGSISKAAQQLGLSYKGAWDAVQALNNLFEAPLVTTQAGGKAGGVAFLTPRGRAVIAAFHRVEAELGAALARLEASLADAPDDDLGALFWSLGMKTSARNALRGVVSHVSDGAVSSEVSLKIAEGLEIVAVVTRHSVAELDLAPGKPAIALIKSSFVTLAVGEGLRTSARNQLRGQVLAREDGAVNTEVTLSLADGKSLTATITRESAQALDLKPGDPVTALVKAPHVILAVE